MMVRAEGGHWEGQGARVTGARLVRSLDTVSGQGGQKSPVGKGRGQRDGGNVSLNPACSALKLINVNSEHAAIIIHY